jgi:hypothetical protein
MSDERETSIPVFSERLDEIMALMIKGELPNIGRFCGYCYTPVTKTATECAHCGRRTADIAPVDKIPSPFFELYRRMRKREALIVNTFAFTGLGIALLIFIVMVGVVVYRYEQSLWMLVGATAFLIIGGRIFAGLLGGWIGDQVGYDYAHRKLVDEWHAFERDRAAGTLAAASNAG